VTSQHTVGERHHQASRGMDEGQHISARAPLHAREARSTAARNGDGPRIRREKRTVEAMVRMYCRGHHGKRAGLCEGCAALLDYAHARLDGCRFGEGKTTCARCAVHCYRPEMRERIRAVMRWAGPRMLLRHPVMAVRHVVDGTRSRTAVVERPRR
jgi:hypothetical protein